MADALSVTGLCARLGGRQILYDIDFAAARGTVTAILGPNGAGKTTLLECLVGLLPYTGAVTVGDVELSALSPRDRAARVAYVPQRSSLDAPLRVRTVVGHGRYAHSGSSVATGDNHETVATAMRATDIEALADRSYLTLSGGEQRRVLIARALATGARVMLLDEPTASLDIKHVLALFQLVRELANNDVCVIMVLHDLNDALAYTDRALLLQDGRIAASGATNDVVTETPIRQVYGVEPVRETRLYFRLPESRDEH